MNSEKSFCQLPELCEQLAHAGFYVMRYDHRDSGSSTCFGFEKDSYNLLALEKKRNANQQREEK